MNDTGAIWVYAVARDGALVAGEAGASGPDDGSGAADPLVGIAGGRVRLVSTEDLTAVVSPVDLAEFGEEPLRRNMERLPWLEAVARIHHDVVSAVAKMTAVVPMRLATVYRTDAGLAQMLGQRKEDFLAVLGRITGRSEWGVKVYAAAPADSPPAHPSSGAPSGTAYLMRRRAQLSAAEDARRAAVASAQRLHSELAGQAVAAALHRPQDPQLSGTADRMIMNAAYLVDDRDRARFAAAVRCAASQNPAVRLEHGSMATVLIRGTGARCRDHRSRGTAMTGGMWSGSAIDDTAIEAAATDATRVDPALERQPIALVDLLDRVLAGGVVLAGEVTLSLADVDMVTVSVRALVASVGALAGQEQDQAL